MSISYDSLGWWTSGQVTGGKVAKMKIIRATVFNLQHNSLFEAILLHLPPEGGTIEAQFFGCSNAISVIFLQCPLDDF